MQATERPIVGVGVLIFRGGQVLLGLRRGAHGAGTWSPPGGHLEYGEEPASCVIREALEETGLDLPSVEFLGITNDVFDAEHRHYVTLFFRADAVSGSGEPEVREPEKCEAWQWWPWDALPENLFLPLRHFVSGAVARV